MQNAMTDAYNGWTIRVNPESNMCSNFSFDIIDSSGHEKHISMGGDNEKRALERAKEMIDMEIELTRDQY
jgi:hypothetical protein